MTYVVSDIHGCFDKFKELLRKINFTDNDIMYVLGDIVDYGEQPIELLCDLSMRVNVIPVLGEREFKAYKLLTALDRMLAEGSMPDPDVLSEMAQWSADGGATTITGFKELDEDMREGVLDYLADMTLYAGKSGSHCAINRGFGSSCPEHHLYYYSRMVRPLAPKVLVYAPGLGNGTSFGYTPDELLPLAQRVVLYALSDFPDLRVYLCGLPARYSSEAALIYNQQLRQFAEETPNCTFVDMADYPQLARTDVLSEDKVHYNAEGYRLYGEMFREVLKDELAHY